MSGRGGVMRWWLTTGVVLLWAAATGAQTESPLTFALHIGVNEAPAGSDLASLRYADDDAVRFYRFTQTFAERSWLVTVMDDATAAEQPEFSMRARAPTRRGIEETLRELKAALQSARRAGRRRALWISFSGHGVVGSGGVGFALLDGALDQSFLEEQVGKLDADEVHLFFDACHAEGVVGGKGVIRRETDVEVTEVDPAIPARGFRDDFFVRHPHIGAVMASAAAQETHEWSRLESGVFTHEVLSALRGPADVNADGQIAYSELSAFVASANRSVVNKKARRRLSLARRA